MHISDVTNIGKPEDFIRSYKKGDVLETIVLSIDSDRERISLGIKQFIESNFDKFTENLSAGAPADKFSVNLSKLDSMNCLIPREILSLSESIESTIVSSTSPFL